MRRLLNITIFVLTIFTAPAPHALAGGGRFALVIGDASYQARSLPTTANDAALVGEALRLAGFAVTGARDLDETALRHTLREFLNVLTQAGPDAVALLYFAGYGLQLEGENYLLPVDAHLTHYSDISLQGVRLSDFMHALAELPLRASFVIIDAARSNPFAMPDLAGGLAWVEPERNMMLAFNAAPGTSVLGDRGSYGAYARALAEMILQGSLAPSDLFDRIRLRVHDLTKGGQIPWNASKVDANFYFLERGALAPVRTDAPEQTAALRLQSMRSLGLQDAYLVALLRDTFDAYGDFLAEYGDDPRARRIVAARAARREAITWRRTYEANTTEAFQTYLERYPHGPHVGDSHRLLDRLAIAQAPEKFALTAMEMPPPPPDEQDYMARPALVLDDPALGLAPPFTATTRFLAPPPREFEDLQLPPAPAGAFKLGAPTLPPLPSYITVPTDTRPARSSLTATKASTGDTATDQQSAPAARLPAEENPPASPEATAAIEASPGKSAPAPTDTGEEHLTGSAPIAALAPTPPDNGNVTPTSIPADLPSGRAETTAPAAAGEISSPDTTTAIIPLPMPRPSTLAPPNSRVPLPIPRSAAVASSLASEAPKPMPTAAGSGTATTGHPPLKPGELRPSLPTGLLGGRAASQNRPPEKPQ